MKTTLFFFLRLEILFFLIKDIFLSEKFDKKYLKTENLLKDFHDGREGKILGWLILCRDKHLLRSLFTNVRKGLHRESYLILKTLFEDTAVAYHYCLNFSFGSGHKKPDIKNSIKEFNKEIPLYIEYKVKDLNQLYGELNRFSHFNFSEYRQSVYNLVQVNPKVKVRMNLEHKFLLALDVYIILYQFFFVVKEFVSANKRSDLQFIAEDENGQLTYMVVPIRILKRINRWVNIYAYLKNEGTYKETKPSLLQFALSLK